MIKHYSGWILMISIFLVGCSDDTPAIVQNDINGNEEESAILVEQTEDESSENEANTMIEFNLENEQIMIELSQVPILENYLAQIQDRQQALDDMKLEKIDSSTKDSLYLLSFSLYEDSGSYLLLDRSDQGSSLLLADLATVSDIIPSPDASKLLFIFNRQNPEKSWQRNKVVILDVENFTPLGVTNEKDLLFTSFKWPIENIAWQDNETILVDIPAIEEPTIAALDLWIESDKMIDQITLAIVGE
ncbi:hypothetical protein [Paraliobacillus sediminis]|uniref:hypothetical protein n=1 Tax=Paraliobacillus sediminis TaxID=1885916 RepID=UPI000E3D76D0|nr:hypothetical protein [Paraliobacillus sediminis]